MDLTTVIARLGVVEVEWIGTSLGGLIGMVLAGQENSPIRRMVVNDVGPFLPWQALHRLANSVRNAPCTFPDLASATSHYRTALAPFGQLTDNEWEHLARHSLAEVDGGGWRKRSDPEITAAFRPGAVLRPEPVELLGRDPLPDAGAPQHGFRTVAAGRRQGDGPARQRADLVEFPVAAMRLP